MSGQRFTDIDYPYPAGTHIWSKRAQAQIYVSQIGEIRADKTSMVLLHPWGGNMIIWKDLVARLSQDSHLVLVDLPGHGKSGKPLGRYPPKRMAAAVADVVESLQLKQPILLGNSLGGATAIETSLMIPKQIKAMVLLGAPGGSNHPAVIVNLVRSFTQTQHVRTVSPAIAHFLWWLIAQTTNPLSAQTVDTTWVNPRQTRQWSLFARAMSKSLHELLHWAPPVQDIAVPTLVVQGKTDIIVWPWLGSKLSTQIKNSIYEPLSGCGHFPQLQCLDQLMKVLRPFLQKHSSNSIK